MVESIDLEIQSALNEMLLREDLHRAFNVSNQFAALAQRRDAEAEALTGEVQLVTEWYEFIRLQPKLRRADSQSIAVTVTKAERQPPPR